jgi:hypothetical protein
MASLLPHFTGPSIFSTAPQRNIPGTICYDVTAVTHFTVVRDTGTRAFSVVEILYIC